jgi:hypothetical protein
VPREPTLWMPFGGSSRLLALRHVTLLAAKGGTSKGLVTIRWAADLTMGRPLPGQDTAMPPGDVILVAPEDDPREGLAQRIFHAGADPDRIINLTELPGGGYFTWPDEHSRRMLMEALDAASNPLLVIIDPLHAVKAKGCNIKADDGARAFMRPLQELTRDREVATVLTHHTVKDGSIAGSQGLLDAARHTLMISRGGRDDPPNLRVLTMAKSNISGEFPPLRYYIVGEDEDRPNEAHVQWEDERPKEERPSRWLVPENTVYPPVTSVVPGEPGPPVSRPAQAGFWDQVRENLTARGVKLPQAS